MILRPHLRLLLWLAIPAIAVAQANGHDKFFDTVPWQQWIAQGDHTGIPWKFKFAKPVLGFHQRLVVSANITVDGRHLAGKGEPGDLLMFWQLEDALGQVAQVHASIVLKELSKDLRKADFNYNQRFLVLPGDYRVTVAMLYSGTGEHNLTRTTLHVDSLGNDPLPAAWQGIPSVEVIPNNEEPPAAWFHPEIQGRLHLPVENHQPVQVSVLMVLPSGRPSGAMYRDYMGAILPEFKIFSHWQLANGGTELAFIDVSKHSVQEINVRDEWAGIKQGLEQNNPNVVDVHSLENRGGEAEFFISQVTKRLNTAQASSERSVEPKRVIIVLGGPLLLGKGFGWASPAVEAGTDYKIYFLRYVPYMLRAQDPRRSTPFSRMAAANGQISDPDLGDPPPDATPRQLGGSGRGRRTPSAGPFPQTLDTLSLEDTLKPLHTQVFDANTPEHFRAALAAIIAELSQK